MNMTDAQLECLSQEAHSQNKSEFHSDQTMLQEKADSFSISLLPTMFSSKQAQKLGRNDTNVQLYLVLSTAKDKHMICRSTEQLMMLSLSAYLKKHIHKINLNPIQTIPCYKKKQVASLPLSFEQCFTVN